MIEGIAYDSRKKSEGMTSFISYLTIVATLAIVASIAIVALFLKSLSMCTFVMANVP